MQQLSKQPAFELGQIVATPGVLAMRQKARQQPGEFLRCPLRRWFGPASWAKGLPPTPWCFLVRDGRVRGYVVQRMSNFFSTWAKSLSLVAREALRWAARAAAKQSV